MPMQVLKPFVFASPRSPVHRLCIVAFQPRAAGHKRHQSLCEDAWTDLGTSSRLRAHDCEHNLGPNGYAFSNNGELTNLRQQPPPTPFSLGHGPEIVDLWGLNGYLLPLSSFENVVEPRRPIHLKGDSASRKNDLDPPQVFEPISKRVGVTAPGPPTKVVPDLLEDCPADDQRNWRTRR